MVFRVEHDLHRRRQSRNFGVAVALIGLIVVVFGLTVVKVRNLGAVQGFDHVLRPELMERSQ